MPRLYKCALAMFALCASAACGSDSASLTDMSQEVDASISVPDVAAEMTEDMPEVAVDAGAEMSSPLDMSPLADMPPATDMLDVGPDLSLDMTPGGGLPSTCEGECAAQELTIVFGEEVRRLERAIYGLTEPSEPGEPWTLYVEALEGEMNKCPTESSFPEYTMSLSGLPIFEDAQPIDKDSHPGLNSNLFDFRGDLVPEPPFRTSASALTVSARALSVCIECVGMPQPSDEDGFLALTVDATFAQGRIAGTLYAVHCDSLDQRSQ